MRTKLIALFGVMMVGLGIFVSLLWSHPKAATKGSVNFTVTTLTYGGNYSPKNAGVAWVADAQDRFVKTLKLWADKRKSNLVKWNAASSGNVVDAVTGATARTPTTQVATWNCTDVTGAIVNDGVYKIYVEFTEDNSASGKPAGKWMVASFTKGTAAQSLTPPDQDFFKAIKLDYVPDAGAALPASLSGSITDAKTASALAAATVQLQSNGQTSATATSNASGQYQFSNLTAGTYTLVASKSGYQNFSQSITLTAGQQVTGKNIALTPVPAPAALSGKVTDANSNAALVNVAVQLQSNGQALYQTTTDASGSYQLQNITAGSYTLVATKGGYQNYSAALALTAGQQVTNKNIALTPNITNGTVSGTVRNANTNVVIGSANVQLKLGNVVQYQTTTNASGAYTIAAVQPATYTLLVFKDGFNAVSQNLTIASGQNLTNQNVVLTPIVNGASLSGTIREAGSNLALAAATVQLKNGSQVLFETTTNASGAYAFANVAAGSYVLAASKNGYNLTSQNVTLSAGQTISNRNLALTKTIVPDTTPPPAPQNISYDVIR